MSGSAASGLLSRQLKLMQSDKGVPGISCGLVSDNIFEWEVMLMITDDCKYYGGTIPLPQHSNHPRLSIIRWLTRSIIHKQEVSTAPTSPSPPNTPSSPQKCLSNPQSSTQTVLRLPPSLPSSPPQKKSPSTYTYPSAHSLPLRRRLHLDPAPPHHRPIRLRIRIRALVARADARNNTLECD